MLRLTDSVVFLMVIFFFKFPCQEFVEEIGGGEKGKDLLIAIHITYREYKPEEMT